MTEGLKKRTANGLIWGAANTLSTQLLMLLFGIVLGRLLSPAEYGMVGMLAIFSAIAGTLQESGFTAALTNLKQATHRDFNAVFWFSSIMAVALYIVLFFSAPLIARFFHQPELIPLSRLTFASFAVSGFGIAHAAYLFRNMMNREKAIANFVALVGSGIVGITLAANGYSYWSLAWQQFAYICILNIGRLYFVRWRPSLHIDLTPIREMFGFSSKLLITNIINQINGNLLSFILGRLLTPTAVGNYTQASKWSGMGQSLISGTMGQVVQPVLASIDDQHDRQLNAFRKMLRFCAFLSMPAMFGLALIADFVVLLLGDKWADSVVLLRILCISGAFMPLQSLYHSLFISHGRSDTYMWCTAIQVAVQICVILAFRAMGVVVMVTAYSTMLILWLGIWHVLANRMVGLRFVDVLKDILPFMFSAVCGVAVAYVVTVPVHQQVLSLIIRFFTTAVLYLLIMKLSGAKIFKESMEYLMSLIKR